MERIPFGVKQLDAIINGGAPAGSVVLLAGEAGAGSREFMHTSAVINGLSRVDEEMYDLYYGGPSETALPPKEVHYISFTASGEQLASEMRLAMDEDLLETALSGIEFHDMSERYFHMSPVPRSWYAEQTPKIEDLRARHERDDLLGALGSKLSDVAAGNLVVIDSLSDLVSAMGEDIDWADITFLVAGLQKAAHKWGGLILLHLNYETLSGARQGQLSDAAHGTMEFSWESGGSTRARTLVVKQFRGVLSQIEDEDIVQFETELGDAGFDISDVRKIR
ncbi:MULTISPECIES: RAD55 family ATPase [Haloarcula]|uniref:HtlC n=1 Tax=Haloarcula pellucida TaxID=1427151 RepID=A0A830GL76_9EURY|nr:MULTISPECIES: HTR-like protein [Halomicroarcula]MBX0348397.1 HTR-like protein [Halomicroarcula pellucida]MDS0278221.1 HTR-like protein [Halomicroarcula sp. S1AR25-4]GGN93560.1 HtlC [Halomicroarcula pellucida]